jgi:hypothetical protein
VSSHVATEQRRRDRINESFRVLREIVPHSDKTDKASFLGEVTAYIRKLQRLVRVPCILTCMHCSRPLVDRSSPTGVLLAAFY